MSYTWQQVKRAERAFEAMENLALALRKDGPGREVHNWTFVLKPLLLKLVGWGRNSQVSEHWDHEGPLSGAALWGELPEQPQARTGMEAWLRTSDAYELVYEELYSRLSGLDKHGRKVSR